MKKHIKKIICLVAVIVLSVTATIVPCFAYEQVDYLSNDLLGANVVSPTITISNRQSELRYSDTFPNYIYDNAINDLSSDAWYIDETYSVGDLWYASYGLYADRYDSTATLTFPVYIVRTDDTNYINQFNFTGWYKFTLDIEYFGDGGQYSELHYDFDYTNETDPTYWKLGDLMPTGKPSGKVFVTISNFQIVNPTDFCFDMPYYTDTNIADLTMRNISADNITQPVYVDNVNVGDFLFNSVKNFLDFEIIEGVSLYVIFISLVGIMLLVWFLKLLAGG